MQDEIAERLGHFVIGPIGDLQLEQQFAWVPVEVHLPADETSAHPWVQISVPVQYRRDWTVDRVRAVAYDKARRVLTEVAEILATCTPERLQQVVEDRDRAEREESRQFWAPTDPTT